MCTVLIPSVAEHPNVVFVIVLLVCFVLLPCCFVRSFIGLFVHSFVPLFVLVKFSLARFDVDNVEM